MAFAMFQWIFLLVPRAQFYLSVLILLIQICQQSKTTSTIGGNKTRFTECVTLLFLKCHSLKFSTAIQHIQIFLSNFFPPPFDPYRIWLHSNCISFICMPMAFAVSSFSTFINYFIESIALLCFVSFFLSSNPSIFRSYFWVSIHNHIHYRFFVVSNTLAQRSWKKNCNNNRMAIVTIIIICTQNRIAGRWASEQQ